MVTFLAKYRKDIIPAMIQRFGYKNPLAVPKLVKIALDTGVGRATDDKEKLQQALDDLALITGQKPVVTKARKSVAGFKIRQGMPVGAAVTLRGARMYEFLERLIVVAIPRIRDFRGLNPKSFDGRGSFTLGLTEQTVFPEVDPNKVKSAIGMHITIVTSAPTDDEGRELLRLFGMPFATA